MAQSAASVPQRPQASSIPSEGPLQIPGQIPGQIPAPAAVSLESLLAIAMKANPELLATRSRVLAAQQRPIQAHALADPTVGLSFRNVGFSDLTLGSEMMSTAGITLSQALPGAGKRPLRRDVAEQGIDIAMAQVDAVRGRVIRQIATAYYELAFTTEAIYVVEETKVLLENLELTAEALYSVGGGIQQDVLKAQVEISILLNRLIQLREQRDSIENRINRSVAQPASTDLPPPAPISLPAPDLDLAVLQREASRRSAVLVQRGEQIEQQEVAVNLARKEVKPDFLVSGSWLSRGALPDIWQLNLGITLPLRKEQRQNRAIEEAIEELSARRFDRANTGLAVAEIVRDAYLQVDRSIRLIALFRDGIIPQSLLSLESAMSGYSVGKVDFLTVLDNVVTLLTYRLELERETAEYMIALVTIEEHVAHSLGATPAAIWAAAPPNPEQPGESGTQTVTATTIEGLSPEGNGQ